MLSVVRYLRVLLGLAGSTVLWAMFKQQGILSVEIDSEERLYCFRGLSICLATLVVEHLSILSSTDVSTCKGRKSTTQLCYLLRIKVITNM